MATRAYVDGHEVSPLRPLRVAEYDRLVELGLFEGERIELLRGVLVAVSPQSPRHAGLIQRLTRLLMRAAGELAAVRVQLPLVLGDDSEPEPDLALVPAGDYMGAHPTRAFLVVEIAAGSLTQDREVKAQLYAEAGIPEYWLVAANLGTVDVHSEPSSGGYARVASHRPGDAIRLAALPGVEIAVSEILG